MRPHDHIDLLELQMTCSMLQNEAQMRYLTSPEVNLPRIRRILLGAFKELQGLRVADAKAACPNGWIHSMCRCIFPTLKAISDHREAKTGGSRGRGIAKRRRRTPVTPTVSH